ncbi:sensor histidine kinase YesM [Paenibacillus forsythiae]|uniref:Sensor histidine kinase YesM n=1 Tax=Paenibacillus forsythiae TaxID=365616 RepID=A0ABU3H3G7_9BACL|nr:histidine kinase [Paenibacillus forsythiae]MDT3425352.1 sensor histidine kinase YesM [Paenibacillus forsythiae]
MVQKRNFKDSIRRMFLLYAFVPISLLFILFLIFTVVNARFMLIHQTKEAGKAIRSSLGEVYQAYWEEVNRMAELPEVIDYTDTRRGSPRVYEEFYNFNNRQQVKSIMHILSRSGEILTSSANLGPESSDHALKAIVLRMSRTGQALLAESNHIRFSHDRYTVYTFAKEIRKDGKVIGYLAYQLYEEDFQKLIFVRNNEIAIVTDQHQTIIATTNNIVRGLLNKLTLEKDNGYIVINDGKYYGSETSIPLAQWRVYTLNAIQLQNYIYLSLVVFFTIASVLLLFLIQALARRVSSRHTRAIDKLIYAVRELQAGNMQSYVHIDSGDEFETLANQYNTMLARLNELLARNEELSDLRRVSEVKHLQSQFHPHFIFNVLETLRYAIVVDNKFAQDIVLILSRLLRYSISTEGSTVMLRDDLNYVGDYLKLQQMRFKDRLNYTLNVSEEAMDALVPRLMLQVVIENSIKYGYRQKDRLQISVNGYVTGPDLTIEVKDDGGGMSEERLRQVREIMLDPDNRSPHVGLNNLNRRLVLMYGERYGVHIDSVAGEGAAVRIIIPYGKEAANV